MLNYVKLSVENGKEISSREFRARVKVLNNYFSNFKEASRQAEYKEINLKEIINNSTVKMPREQKKKKQTKRKTHKP